MTRHDRLDDAARDRAAAFAFGTMGSDEASGFERHLEECEVCRREVDALRPVCDGLVHLAPSVAPPPALKERLLARIQPAVQAWKGWTSARAAGGLTLVPAGESGWEPTGVDGVEVRKLFLDPGHDRVTMLVRMAAGTSYPSHRHSGFEECYVLEGDLLVGDYRMRAGDYQRAEGGSVHGIQSTQAGCLLFIVSSLHDELLEGPAAT